MVSCAAEVLSASHDQLTVLDCVFVKTHFLTQNGKAVVILPSPIIMLSDSSCESRVYDH